MRRASFLLLASASLCLAAPATQPAGNIVELRARRAELERTIAAATAELRAVTASIAKLGKPETFPISHLEEAKAKLTAVQYEQAQKIKFQGVSGVNEPGRNGVWVQMGKGPLPSGITARWRLLYKEGNSPWKVWDSGAHSLTVGEDGRNGATSINIPVANAHVVVSVAGTPIYETVWKTEKAPVAPNGIPWWRDDTLIPR